MACGRPRCCCTTRTPPPDHARLHEERKRLAAEAEAQRRLQGRRRSERSQHDEASGVGIEGVEEHRGREAKREADRLRKALRRAGDELRLTQTRRDHLRGEQAERIKPRAPTHAQRKANREHDREPPLPQEQSSERRRHHEASHHAGGDLIHGVGKGKHAAHRCSEQFSLILAVFHGIHRRFPTWAAALPCPSTVANRGSWRTVVGDRTRRPVNCRQFSFVANDFWRQNARPPVHNRTRAPAPRTPRGRRIR